MSPLGAFAAAAIALIGWIALSYFAMRRKDVRLMAVRRGMTDENAVKALTSAGADPDVAHAVVTWIDDYYGSQTTRHPDDRFDTDIAIDPEDMEDFVENFFAKHGMPMPTADRPEVLPDYQETTLTSFAIYLTMRRAALLGERTSEA